MRLIDGDELVSWIDDLTQSEKLSDEAKMALSAVAGKLIVDMPTVEAEPKHGRWIFGSTKGHSWMKCSECCVSQSGQTATFTYCPNCGAKMDLDEVDND